MKKIVVGIIVLLVVGGLGWTVYQRVQNLGEESAGGRGGGGPEAAPVEVAPIERGEIVLRRTFSGTLLATAEFAVAPKTSGRIRELTVDLADPVTRGQVIAVLDSDEFVQEVAQAEAELAVARANLTEANNALEIANRALERTETLRQRGVSSESQLDAAKADQLAAEAQVQVARAQMTRAEAALESARIRLDYTKVTADWSGGDEERVVSERHVDEGDTVSTNTPIVSVVELDPITGEIFVTEKDYARLQPGQPATLTTDAWPGETFPGEIARISPVFRQNSRQARLELTIANPEQRLKPGMFTRATIVLETIPDATIVPDLALTTRADRQGVFTVNEGEMTVTWRPVQVGIREGDRIQIFGEGLTGRVVTLGQQLVDDGSPITIPEYDDGNGNNEGGPEPETVDTPDATPTPDPATTDIAAATGAAGA